MYVIHLYHCIVLAEVRQAERWLWINVVVMNISLRRNKHKSASRSETSMCLKIGKHDKYKLVIKVLYKDKTKQKNTPFRSFYYAVHTSLEDAFKCFCYLIFLFENVNVQLMRFFGLKLMLENKNL